jgi:DNA-binding MarR family transcriptional regulator
MQINIEVNWSFKVIKKILKKELVRRVGEVVAFRRRVHLYTTPKQLLMLCHWIPHNILFNPRQRVLSFYG